jgi:PKD repeat protein
MIRVILYIIWLLFSFQAFASESIFVDVKKDAPYYDAVNFLVESRVIHDRWNGYFYPESPMTRDFYVSLAVGVGCKKCTTPTIEDIIKYTESPFIDLEKNNPYYYCIAYAAEKWITQWYTIKDGETKTCENGKSYTTTPFCWDNTITRIEAVAIFLRRAELWNESLNSGNFEQKITIPDVSKNWYGYAQKWIEAGILQQNQNGNVSPDEKITRGEFAIMAAKILEYTQCQTKEVFLNTASEIQVTDTNNTLITKTEFTKWDIYFLIPKVSIPENSLNFSWTATPIPSSWSEKTTQVSFSWTKFPGILLGEWRWQIQLSVLLQNTQISESTMMLTVLPNAKNQENTTNTSGSVSWNNNTNTKTDSPSPSLLIEASPLTNLRENVTYFRSIQQNISANAVYMWDFWDGMIYSGTGNTWHAYTDAGIYPVTLTVTDLQKNIVLQSKLAIEITGEKDTDKDGIVDSLDICPQVYGITALSGCPPVENGNFGKRIYESLFWQYHTPSKYDNNSNITTSNTSNTPTSGSNPWSAGRDNSTNTSPRWNTSLTGDSDGDGIPDTSDLCIYTKGTKEYFGCPNISDISTLPINNCYANKAQEDGIIIGGPVCSQCPCTNTYIQDATLRTCDIIFPTILSTDKNTIFSRGDFVIVP